MNFTSALLFVLKQVTWPSYHERGLFILISKYVFMLLSFPSHVIENHGFHLREKNEKGFFFVLKTDRNTQKGGLLFLSTG